MTVGLVKGLPGWLVFVVVAIAATVAGALLYQLVERPLMARLNKFGRNRIYGAEARPVTP
jgi:peptidoglycan/LPS O-acetylase OafA/YrhL